MKMDRVIRKGDNERRARNYVCVYPEGEHSDNQKDRVRKGD